MHTLRPVINFPRLSNQDRLLPVAGNSGLKYGAAGNSTVGPFACAQHEPYPQIHGYIISDPSLFPFHAASNYPFYEPRKRSSQYT